MKSNPGLSKKMFPVAIYVMLFVLFRTLFVLIMPYYLDSGSTTTHPIDAHVTSLSLLFDDKYVTAAKHTGYRIDQYYKLFLPLDLLFPAVYTGMFLRLLKLYKKCSLFGFFKWLIIIGCLLDYLENISFSIFLQLKGDHFASVVAYFTSFKTILFVVNMLVFLLGLLVALLLLAGIIKQKGNGQSISAS